MKFLRKYNLYIMLVILLLLFIFEANVVGFTLSNSFVQSAVEIIVVAFVFFIIYIYKKLKKKKDSQS